MLGGGLTDAFAEGSSANGDTFTQFDPFLGGGAERGIGAWPTARCVVASGHAGLSMPAGGVVLGRAR